MQQLTVNGKIRLISNMDSESITTQPKQKLAPPPSFYQVIMFNDDYTPMEFVVMLLQSHFSKNLEEATEIMLAIHYTGAGVCGVYPKDIAQTKVKLVMDEAYQAQHPLQCVMEII